MLDTRLCLLEVVSELLGVASEAGFLTYVNPVWESSLGFTEKELTAQPYLNLIHPDDLDETIDAMDAVVQSRSSASFENRCIAKDGTYRSISWQVRVSPEQPELLFAGHDITDHREVEAVRAQLIQNEEVIFAATHTWNSDQIQDNLLSVISHELRAPLYPILGWTHLLKSQTLSTEEMQAGLQMIERSAEHQLRVLEELLLAASLLRGQLSLTRVPMNLVDVVSAAIDVAEPMAIEKGIEIQEKGFLDTFDINGDSMRLQQAISNLLSNAIKFTSSGGTVRVVLFSRDQQAYVQIADTGRGISADILPHVFECFQQPESSATHSFDGLGLGLMISQHLVGMHDGAISVESPGEGKGTMVTVRLPLRS